MIDQNEIDFSVKKTEAGWQHIIDSFFLSATPKLYEWLRWVITLAAITYVQNKTNSAFISAVLQTTYLFTTFYFIANFYQFRFKGLPLIKNPKIALFASLLISGLLAYFTWYMVTEAVNAVVLSQP